MGIELDHGAGDDVYVVAVSGELDLATVPELRSAFGAAAAGGSPVVLDVSNVSFIDSTALAALLRANDEIASSGAGMVVVCPPGRAVRRLLSMTSLEDRLTLAPDRASARAQALGATQ
jgi:anti-sigma B factor antagonist